MLIALEFSLYSMEVCCGFSSLYFTASFSFVFFLFCCLYLMSWHLTLWVMMSTHHLLLDWGDVIRAYWCIHHQVMSSGLMGSYILRWCHPGLWVHISSGDVIQAYGAPYGFIYPQVMSSGRMGSYILRWCHPGLWKWNDGVLGLFCAHCLG